MGYNTVVNCPGKYICFEEFRKLIKSISQNINQLYNEISNDFKTYSQVSKLSNHINCDQFGEYTSISVEELKLIYEKELNYNFDDDVSKKWVKARQNLLTES